MASFSLIIEKMVSENSMLYMEALSLYVEENDMDEKTVAKLISPAIRQALYKEVTDLRIIVPNKKG